MIFTKFWVTLRRSRRRDLWNFFLKPSLSHNNDTSTLYTSCTAPGMLRGLWKTSPQFSSFSKHPKWQFPKVRQLSARISRQRKEIARWTRGDSESSDDLLSMIIAQNFDLKLPSGCKIGLKMSSFCKKCVKRNLTLWRHSDITVWSKNVYVVFNL